MKKRTLAALMTITLLICTYLPVSASTLQVEDIGREYYEPTLMITTCYTPGDSGSITADGTRVHDGICAMRREWIGKTAVVYAAIPTEHGYRVGDRLGVFEVRDTGYGRDLGGYGTIEAGKHIDIYKSRFEDAVAWMELTQGQVFVQVINAKG